MKHTWLMPLRAMVSAAALSGCADSGQESVSVPLGVAGSELSEPVAAAGDVSVTITRADLAFGPLYLCAGAQAGALCDTARLEWLDSAVVDVLDPAPHAVGTLNGVSGRVQSYMYDLGITSLLTRQEPLVLPAAAALGGVSLLLEGSAEAGGQRLPFEVHLAIRQDEQTEAGVPVVRKSTSEVFARDVTQGEPGLLVRFDATTWLAGVDFRVYRDEAGCVSGGPELACAGNVEQRCDADGAVLEARDCASLGQVCVAGVGCRERIAIEAGSQAYRSIRNAVVVGTRPSFEWRELTW